MYTIKCGKQGRRFGLVHTTYSSVHMCVCVYTPSFFSPPLESSRAGLYHYHRHHHREQQHDAHYPPIVRPVHFSTPAAYCYSYSCFLSLIHLLSGSNSMEPTSTRVTSSIVSLCLSLTVSKNCCILLLYKGYTCSHCSQ